MTWGRRLLAIGLMLVVLAGFGLALAWRWYSGQSSSNNNIRRWLTDVTIRSDWRTPARLKCGDAPFIVPSEGFIGLYWSDPAAPYTPWRRHSGIDIFGDGASGAVPIYAVYDGYLTRLPDWRSTVIIRHDDPLQPGRNIWTYYTHMASRDGQTSYVASDFPPGTIEYFVRQGDLLGHQGEYAGTGVPIAMHLHFSIVLDDGAGAFLNEAVLANTLDPSPYFGIPLRVEDNPQPPVICP